MRKAIMLKKKYLRKTRKITYYGQFKTQIETMFINYLDLVRELRKLGNVEVTVVPVVIRDCRKTVGSEN